MSIVDKIRAALGGKEAAPDAEAPVELWSPKLGEDYKSFWDNMAKDRAGAYLAVAGEPFGRPATEESLSAHGKDTAAIIAKVLSIGKDDRVLEVGVGVGRIAEHVAPLCRSFTGTDIAENMIKFARERMKGRDNVTLVSRDRSDLAPFPDASFDKIYLQVVLIHLDREDAFHYMREAYRALAPKGLAWFQFYNLLHPKGFKEFRFAVDYMVEKGQKTRGRVHCYTAAEVRELVTRAGFRVREDLSHLGEREQKFGFQIPDTDWEFYLIAVGERP
ncbi:MAG TPA: class I SAM-dependent methyltransferase [bacterium]|nr:class I SAM-dependent methyltransferase [bacterium]